MLTLQSNPYHIPRSILKKHAKDGPRYTSYPTAPLWENAFTQETARQIYQANNPQDSQAPLALYFHLPFCTSLCWYCGCNIKIARNKAVLTPYLRALETELKLMNREIAPQRTVTQMHWGGGTPTYLSPEQITILTARIKQHFCFEPEAELSIEVDPRVTTIAHLESLRAAGFNRISMGIQDFNPRVQAAVNRRQSFEATEALIASCRRLGFLSINLDLMYGLPFQTVDSFQETLFQIQTLNPDRIALFHYAHVPWIKPAQKLIDQADLPSSEVKLDIFELAIESLLKQGYRYIGMDHFAKPNDPLTLAQEQHSLRRNFMGYTTQAGVDLYGFGVSSISEIDGHFIQNQRYIPDYQAVLSLGHLPTARGMVLSPEDHLRKAVIEALICNGYLDFKRLEQQFQIDFIAHFAQEIEAMLPLTEDGLVQMGEQFIQVLPRGQILIRNICMVWDAYLKEQASQKVFSKVL